MYIVIIINNYLFIISYYDYKKQINNQENMVLFLQVLCDLIFVGFFLWIIYCWNYCRDVGNCVISSEISEGGV